MLTAGSVEQAGSFRAPAVLSAHRRRPLLEDLLLPASIGLFVAGIRTTDAAHLGEYGLPASLSGVYYAGLAILLVSTSVALSRRAISQLRLTLHLGAVLFVLYGTAPLLYTYSRYSWQYKVIGVAQYVAAHGRLNPAIDIYQQWPGFFALVAWFDKVTGLQTPVSYAKWSQLFFEVLTCITLSFAFRAIRIGERERWLALFLYAGSVWIAQDYLSPQALAVVLSTGLFAIVLHFLGSDRSRSLAAKLGSRLSRLFRAALASDEADEGSVVSPAPPVQWGLLVALTGIFFAIVVTHELSPYVMIAQLGVVALVVRLRPWWLVLVFMAVAGGYLAPRFSYVNAHYGLLASLGNFFGNVKPPSATTTPLFDPGTHVAALAARTLSLGMWGLAAVGAWRRWRAREPVLVLLVLAGAPIFVAFAQAYGGEAILRVYLFSLPWTACLAASALRWRPAPKPSRLRQNLHRAGALWAPAALVVVIGLFYPAFFGNDSIYVMPAGEVRAVLAFYDQARPGVVLTPNSNFPGNLGSRYPDFPSEALFGTGDPLGNRPVSLDEASSVVRRIDRANTTGLATYVIITSSMREYARAYGSPSPSDLSALTTILSQASGWFNIYRSPEVLIFELPPAE